jgi:hypothetical protein
MIRNPLPYCQDCGHQAAETDKFCTSCGASVTSDSAPANSSSEPPQSEAAKYKSATANWPSEWYAEVDFENDQAIQAVQIEVEGLLNKKVTVGFCLTTYLVGMDDVRDTYNIKPLTVLPLVELDDVVVVNKHNESSRLGVGFYKGIGAWASGGSSRTVGDLMFMSGGREIFQIKEIHDPYGLKALILSTKRQNQIVTGREEEMARLTAGLVLPLRVNAVLRKGGVAGLLNSLYFCRRG